jgi:hypothetical protein
MSYSDAFSSKSIISNNSQTRGSAGLYYENPSFIPQQNAPKTEQFVAPPPSPSPLSPPLPYPSPLQDPPQQQRIRSASESEPKTQPKSQNPLVNSPEKNIMAYAGGGLLLLFMIELIFNLGKNAR